MPKRQKLKDANPKPCAQCPWRIDNQGKRHRHGFYTKKNLRRLWTGMRNGERMTCHPTDPEMAEFEGYEKTAEREVTHECTGALILCQREIMRFQAEFPGGELEPSPEAAKEALRSYRAKEALRSYRAKHPKGLTKVGLYRHMLAAAMDGTPLSGPTMARPDLNTEGIGAPDVVPWTPGEVSRG